MKRFLLTLAVLQLGTAALMADEATSPSLSFEGPRIVGADFALNSGSLKLSAGAGYEAWDFGRDALGSPGGDRSSWWLLDGTLAVRQTWSLPEADLWTAAGGIGWTSLGNEAPGVFPRDKGAGALAFVRTGLTRDRYARGPRGVVSGTRAEAQVEVGPALLSMSGSDYYKLTLQTSALVPLWNLEAPAHLFSGTLGLRANTQWIDGSSVPLVLLEGTEVRGYHRLVDSRWRSVLTGELRVGLPSLVGDHDLVPVVFCFTEGGWYSGFAGAPGAAAQASGWLSSVGAGFGLAVFGMATLNASLALPLSDGESDLWWSPGFNLRF